MSELAKEIKAPTDNDQVVSWITDHLKKHDFLLAFADDGVIWGKMDGETLVTSHKFDGSISPELRGKTLQQAFIFDAKEEIRLFRDEMNQWQARKVTDAKDKKRVIEESQILWGDEAVGELQNGFLQVRDNTKGIPNQFIPAKEKIAVGKCLRLDVHHSVDYNENGEAYIVISRLAGLRIGNRNEEVLR